MFCLRSVASARARLTIPATVLAVILSACGAQPSSFKENEGGREGSLTQGSEKERLDGSRGSADASSGEGRDGGDKGTHNEVSDFGRYPGQGPKVTDGGDKPGQGGEQGNGGKPLPPEQVLVEDGGSLVIPGEKVERVGINFEDWTDYDYNDSVLCFVGAFKVEGTSVVSYKEQEVTAQVFSASGCNHEITAEIRHADGTVQTLKYLSKGTPDLKLKFGVKSRLFVTMRPISGICDRAPRPMDKPEFAKVELDVCRNSGD